MRDNSLAEAKRWRQEFGETKGPTITSLRPSAACLLAALLLPALALAAEIPIDGCVTVPGGRPAAAAQAQLRPILSMYEDGVLALRGKNKPEPVERVAMDDEGCFTLRAPDTGMWRVTVEAPGFVPMEQWLMPLFEAASLPLLELEPDVGLRVRIEDSDGKPLQGARVRVSRTWPKLRSGWVPAPREGVTSADGFLHLPRATQEELELWAVAPGRLPRHSPRVTDSMASLRLDPGVLRTFKLTRAEDDKPLPGTLLWHHPSRLLLGRTDEAGETVLATPVLEQFEIITIAPDDRINGSRVRAKAREVERVDLVLTGPVMIQGNVEDSASRRPVAGALAWPEHDPAAFVRATDRGRFRLPWTPGSGIRIGAAAPGFLPTAGKPLSASSPLRIALEPTLHLDGTVVDAEGKPLPGVEVRALSLELEATGLPVVDRSRSDASGHFRMPLWAGQYRLLAAHPGYAPAFSGAAVSDSPGKRSVVRLVLRQGRSLTGLVVDGDGQPVDGADIELLPTAGKISGFDFFERPQDLGSYRARTGPEGRFEVRDLPPSWFQLRIEHPGFAPHEREGIVIPDGPGAVEAGTFVLEAGLTVEGVVVDSQARPLPETAIWLRTRNSDEKVFLRGPRQVTGPDGRFSIAHLEPGEEWTLYACRKGHPEVFLDLGETAPGPLRIVLAPARRLTGRVVDPDGHPIPGASVTAWLAGESPGHGSGSPTSCSDDVFPQAYTGGEGRFVLESVRSGFYDLQASAAGWLEADHGRVEIREDGEPEEVEIVLRRGAILTGRVLTGDGAPAAGATVRADGGNTPSTLADETGSYRLQGIEPGWRQIAVEGEHGSARQKIQLGLGESRLDMTLEPDAPEPPDPEIHGRVVGPGDEPVAGAKVATAWNEAFTGSDGSFTLSLGGGESRMTAWKEGYAATVVDVDLHNPPLQGLEIRLEKALILTGHLLGLDPEEISIAEVEVQESSVQHRSTVFPDGTYRIGDLGPGEWKVTAAAGERWVEDHVVLRPGEEGATHDLVFPERFAVRGRVVGAGGEGIAAKVQITFPSRDWKSFETQEDGSFETQLGNGDYEIQGSAPGHRPNPPRKLTVADAPVDGLEIQLDSGLVLRGCIRDFPSRRDPGDRIVWIQAHGPDRSSVSVNPDAEGCYEFDTLTQGTWTLTSTLLESRPGQRRREARAEVLLLENEAVADLDFFLGDLTLSGRVEPPGEPSRIFAKLLLPDGSLLVDDPAQLQDGVFRFPRLRAGSYRLQIRDDEGAPLLDQSVNLASDQEIVVSLPVR